MLSTQQKTILASILQIVHNDARDAMKCPDLEGGTIVLFDIEDVDGVYDAEHAVDEIGDILATLYDDKILDEDS